MTDKLDLEDLGHLARVAEGRGAEVPEAAVARLMLAGLVRRPGLICEGRLCSNSRPRDWHGSARATSEARGTRICAPGPYG